MRGRALDLEAQKERGRLRGLANRRHGGSRSSTFKTWQSMRQRCENPKDEHYPDYGGRGIKVCERWQTFENFLADMGEKPKRMTLDRVRVEGHYEPGNCRWASVTEQNRNKRSNRMVTFKGETKCVAEWASAYGVSRNILLYRLDAGWSVEDALTAPKRRYAVRK